MYVRSPDKSPVNVEIDSLISRLGLTRESEIRAYLQPKYSDVEINEYLDYRYLVRSKKRLNPEPIHPLLRAALIFALGFSLVFIHYTFLVEVDFYPSSERISNSRPGLMLMYTVFVGIVYYLTFYMGITLVAVSLWQTVKFLFRKSSD